MSENLWVVNRTCDTYTLHTGVSVVTVDLYLHMLYSGFTNGNLRIAVLHNGTHYGQTIQIIRVF